MSKPSENGIYTLIFELDNMGTKYERKVENFYQALGNIGGLFLLLWGLIKVILLPFEDDILI